MEICLYSWPIWDVASRQHIDLEAGEMANDYLKREPYSYWAIRWGSITDFNKGFADIVEEIHDVASRWQFIFHLNITEAHDVANQFAKEGNGATSRNAFVAPICGQSIWFG